MDSQASWTFRILFNDALNLKTGGQVNRETFQPCLCPLNLVKVLPSSFPFFFSLNLTHFPQLVLPMLFASSQGIASQEEMALP